MAVHSQMSKQSGLNQELKKGWRSLCTDNPGIWSECIMLVEYTFNRTVSISGCLCLSATAVQTPGGGQHTVFPSAAAFMRLLYCRKTCKGLLFVVSPYQSGQQRSAFFYPVLFVRLCLPKSIRVHSTVYFMCPDISPNNHVL